MAGFKSERVAGFVGIRIDCCNTAIRRQSEVERTCPGRSRTDVNVESRMGAVAWSRLPNAPFPIPAHRTQGTDISDRLAVVLKVALRLDAAYAIPFLWLSQ